MTTKLTLTIEDKVINAAKKYARQNGKSLSDIVENYLKSIAGKEITTDDVSSKVAKLKGVIKLQEDFDYKKDLGAALLNKYRQQ
jgi:hypothetical protein